MKLKRQGMTTETKVQRKILSTDFADCRRFDVLARSRNSLYFVLPAKAGIQSFH